MSDFPLGFPKRYASVMGVIAAVAVLTGCGGGNADYDEPLMETPPPIPASSYAAISLVVDNQSTPGYAGETDRKVDPSLLNAWGLAFNPSGVAWVANHGSAKSTLYDGNGVINTLAPAMPLNFKPTGIVFNSTSDFRISNGTAAANAVFMFASDKGKIAGWSPVVDRNNALQTFDNGGSGAVYTGLANGNANSVNVLYAADFSNARVDVVDGSFKKTTLAGNFADPALPTGYAPFGIHNIGGKVYVTYAKQNANRREHVVGAGLGMISVFDTSGNFLKRLVSTGGALNAPWGLAKAPADFGAVANMLLVANAGDGKINAFDLETGKLAGALSTANRTPIVIDGLWGLGFGNGVANQPTNTLYFTAGPGKQAHGVYGRIDLK